MDLPVAPEMREGSLSESGLESKLDLGTGSGGPFTIDANRLVTGRTCVLGSSGSGKSYAVGVLCEELCRNQVPFAVVDTEGEHTGLKEKFDVIWVGEDRECDLAWGNLDVEDLARQAPDISPLILDVSDLPDPGPKIAAFVEALYGTLSERRTPYLLVIEEADKFVPQYGQRIPIFGEVARRGRKRGLGLMICSQRPSLVDKNVLSQCGNQLIGKLIIQNDLQSVAQFFPGKGLPKELTTLRAGQFFAMGGLAAPPVLVAIKKRVTRPGGATPSLARREVKKYVGTLKPRAAGEAERRGTTGAAGEESELGLPPSIRAEDIPVIVKRERSFGIFGPRETITSVDPRFRTLIQLGVKLRRGLLKRRFETVYAYLDGVSGKEVSIERGLRVLDGFQKLLDLTTLQVEVLKEVKTESDTSAIDVASALGETKPTISRVLAQLDGRRLVRTIEVRKRKLYRRLTDLPGKPSESAPLDLVPVETGGATIVPPRVKESSVRAVVKGLWEGADVDSFEPFLYPTFEVELVVRRKLRKVLVDGRSGRELVF